MTYAFTFDSSACSGCKACQEACKDKNNLPVGVMWRRVIEVSGGGWVQTGNAWTNNVFAYNLSIACNHCVHPKCAGVCPTDAYIHRSDGIVYIDPSKCMGCGYCSWACPYNAPRYNADLGQMSKCNFCFDNIDAGLPPSCVAACPMRVLSFAEVNSNQLSVISGQFLELWDLPASEHPFPLPNNSRTEPHLAVKPHRAMGNDLEKKISNYEEIRPKAQKSEMPLVLFTLLVQMAVGMFWAIQWMTDSIHLIPYLFVGACLGLGGFFSFAHLGAKRNAWRAPFHLKKSWLSREILFVGLFGIGWLVLCCLR
jgi:anaerobic dimethyl sulfoxide reductase subunit B (iron-sulfur subunit)